MLGNLGDKAGDLANKGKDALNSDKGEQISDKGLDGAADAANKVTGGKFEDKIQGGGDKADGALGNDGQ